MFLLGPQAEEQLYCGVCHRFGFSQGSKVDIRHGDGSLVTLRDSGHNGCEKCSLIYECCVQTLSLSEDVEFQRHYFVTVYSESPPRLSLSSVHKGSERHLGVVEIYFEIGTIAPPWANIKPARSLLRSRRLGYESLISEWASNCDASHLGCQRSIQNLPTRVLNINCGSTDVCNLYISHGEAGSYTALSYC
jgi:hypothetical protein